MGESRAVPGRAGISSLSAVDHLLAEGKPWTREGGGIDQSQPRPARQRPLFAVFLTVGGIADDAVFRVLGGDVAPPREKKGAGAHLAFMYRKRRKRRRAAVGGSAWAGCQGRRDQGSSIRSRQVGSNRHLGSRASGAGCPFLIRAERKMVRTGAATARSEDR